MISTPYLIQRLTAARPSSMKIDKVFGGEMLGLSDDAWEVLYQAFSIDYMGAAEYEFGVLPRALKQIFDERQDYSAWSFALPAKVIKPGWWREQFLHRARQKEIDKAKKDGVKVPRSNPKKLGETTGLKAIEDRTIYVFAPSKERQDVETMIGEIAKGGVHTKNGHQFDYALDPEPREGYSKNVCGWLDLDNRLFFFTDEVMWKATCEIFGRPVQESISSVEGA